MQESEKGEPGPAISARDILAKGTMEDGNALLQEFPGHEPGVTTLYTFIGINVSQETGGKTSSGELPVIGEIFVSFLCRVPIAAGEYGPPSPHSPGE